MKAEVFERPAAVLDAERMLRMLGESMQDQLDSIELRNLDLVLSMTCQVAQR